MKLKKFAAMMLAGVMAVSMLAGCSGKGGNNGGEVVVEPSSSSIVAAFNNGQDEDNDVKVTFTADSGLENTLKKAVTLAGSVISSNVDKDDVETAIELLTGKTYDPLYTEDDIDDSTDKEVNTALYVLDRFDSDEYWEESDVVKAAARAVNKEIADLFADNRDDTAVGAKYDSCSYTGTVAMVKVEVGNGTSAYWVVYTLTQTVAKQDV